jgi:hypothetical protein
MNFRTKFYGFLIAAVILTGCISTQNSKLIELYTDKMGPFQGESAGDIIPIITNDWEFKIQSRWAIADPSPEMILKRNHRRAPFSKKEANEIFLEKGYYNVLVFAKKGSEKVALEIRSYGRETAELGFREHARKTTDYVFLRLVFRDKKLQNFRCFCAEISD